MSTDEYDLYRVDMNGNILDYYKDAVLTEHSDELDSFKGGAKFKMPDRSQHHLFDGLFSEFQIWRKGKFFDWVVAIKPKSTPNTDGVLEVQCNSLLWYFTRRVFGSAHPTQLLVNNDFEADLPGPDLIPTGWYRANSRIDEIGDLFFTGTRAVRCFNDVEQAEAFLGQIVPHATTVLGDYAVLTAWFLLETFLGPAHDQRGIYMDSLVSGVSQDRASWFPLTASTPTGVWTRAQAAVQLDPETPTAAYDARLYIPRGQIVYDTTSMNFEDSISTPPGGSDQVGLLGAIIAYAQDVAAGKSNLNIGLDAAMTGVVRNLSYLFTENKQIFAAIADFATYIDGVDFAMDFPHADDAIPGEVNVRNIKTWAKVPGLVAGRGRVWDPSELVLRVNIEIGSVEPAQDGDQVTTAMIVQSGNSGPGREQGGYVDASHYGGLILETVEQAPEYVSYNGLQGLAKQRCLQLNSGAQIPVLKTRETAAHPLIGQLKVGDTVPVDLEYGGWPVWEDSYRVVKAVLDPVEDSLDLTLNVVAL